MMNALYPVIYLAFADDPKNPLELLENEGYEIYRCLSSGAGKLYFQLHREPFATTNRITDFLLENKDRIHLFHYGGHANSQEIFLREEAANAKGLAALLQSLQANLKLVFLNGCSTRGQVEDLLKSGIPAVIATSRPIQDQRAKEFAVYLYKALVEGEELEKAFDQAAAMLQTKTGIRIKIYRNLAVRNEQDEEGFLEWGLYISNPAILRWQLPTNPNNQIIIKGPKSPSSHHNSKIDIQLIQDLYSTLSAFHPKLKNFGNFNEISNRSLRLLRRELIDALPAPLGEQIRKLFSADSGPQAEIMRRASLERLGQLLFTYEVLMDLLAAIAFAQLWESLLSKSETVVSDELKTEFINFFSLNKEERKLYNLSTLLRKISFLFHDNKINGFVEEINDISRTLIEDEEFLMAIQFMEGLKQEMFSSNFKVGEHEIETRCLQAEKHLGTLFRKWGFCSKYTYVSVKGIEVHSPRHKEASFLHNKVYLDMVTAGYEDEENPHAIFTHTRSIIVTKRAESINAFLNLSPFFIDENALKKLPHTKIYMYSHYDKLKDIIYYRSAFDYEKYLEISQDNFPEIKEQFDQFIDIIFR